MNEDLEHLPPQAVMIHVQHLLGVGHLSRAAAIARACAARGLATLLVSGGLPVATLRTGEARFLQLPPIRSRDAGFSGLVDAEGRDLDEAAKAARRERLLAIYRAARPRVLVTELYPFGRRQLRFELEPLIATARQSQPRPWIVASLRDILNPPGSHEKCAWMTETARRDYDRLLVHADPALVRLETHFPPAAASAGRLRYTGYLLDPAAAEEPASEAGRGEVLVSAGGGAVAGPLIEAALGARALSPLAELTWRILIGGNYPEASFQEIRARARDIAPEGLPGGFVVERARPDFAALLARCRLSISQGGYNTLLEVLRAGAPAVIVPFETADEQEQAERARLLASRGLLTHRPAAGLSAAFLAAAVAAEIEAAPGRPKLPDAGLDMAGATRTAEIIADLSARLPDETS